jgi:hypothetical protein
MRVINVPGKLRLSSALLLLAVPAVAFQSVIVARAPWWRLPVQSIEIRCATAALLALPLALWIQAGKRWALGLGCALIAAWVAGSGVLAVRAQQPAMGFFTLFLIVCFGGVLSWVDRELERSFFDPQIRWFQKLPKPIPGLSCEMSKGGAGQALEPFRVCRMDEEGAFLYREPRSGPATSFGRKETLTLRFSFRGRQVEATAVPVRDLRGGLGVGVQFKDLPADSFKNIGDFVELLRGEGYVA